MKNLSASDLEAESRPSYVKETRRPARWCENNVPITLRPVRLIQLILDVMLFSITVSFLTRVKNPMGTVASIFLIILFTSFAIIMSIDAVGQIRGYLTPDLPMFLVALLGLILFTSAAQAVYLLVYQAENNGPVLVLIAICLVAALLFLLDAAIMIMYWRYTYANKDKCLPCFPRRSLKILYQRPENVKPNGNLKIRLRESNSIARADISTSVSKDMQRSSNSEFLSNPSNNWVGVGYRREYIDCSTNPCSNTFVKLVETQTEAVEPTEYTDNETTAVAVTEETDVQTLSQCPICSAALDYSPEGICPSFLALVQNFRTFSCPGNLQVKPEAPVLVDRGTLPGSNSNFNLKESTVIVTKRPPRVYETRPCPTHGAGLIAQRAGLPSPVTRISLAHSIRKNKRTQTPATKPIVISNKYQNTEIKEVKAETITEDSHPHKDIFSKEQSSKKMNFTIQERSVPVKIEGSTKGINVENFQEPRGRFNGEEVLELEEIKVQNPKYSAITKIEESSTKTEKNSLPKEESIFPKVPSSFEKQDFVEEFKVTTEETGVPEFLKMEEKSPFQGSFNLHRSSEKLNVPFRESSILATNPEENTKKELPLKEESLLTKVLSNFIKTDKPTNEKSNFDKNIFQKNNKVESITSPETSPIISESSTFAEITSPLESTIRLPEAIRYSNESRDLASPGLCSQYYYKDVFGRYICGQCSHKYLIKIPQRCTVRPLGDIRCCSCSQAIFYQVPNCGQPKCGSYCRCKLRYQLYGEAVGNNVKIYKNKLKK